MGFYRKLHFSTNFKQDFEGFGDGKIGYNPDFEGFGGKMHYPAAKEK